MLFQTPGGNMEVWQVLKTKNTQVYFNGEPAKEWTITWPMEPMISSQRAGVELPLHHEDHIQHKRPQNRTFQSQKKNSPFPLHHVFFWATSHLLQAIEKKLDHRCSPVAFMGGMKYS